MAITDAKNALTLLDEKKFDAVILDLAMPVFTGIDFLESLKNNCKIHQNKIIVLTASNISKEEEQDILRMGVKAVLRKPMKLDSLMDVLVS